VLGDTGLVLLRMSGKEELGRLPEFQLDFVSPKESIEPNKVLGKNLSWSVEQANGELRYFNGFVTRFSEAGETGTSAFEDSRKGKSFSYRATVNPWLWFLTRASHSRMWENLSVVDVVRQIAQSYGAMLDLKLSGSYARRKYIVQYRETDFNFFCRLLEQEGIYFAFKYDNGKNTCVLMDSGGMPGFEALFHQPSRGATDKDHISSWSVSREIQPGKYKIVDYNYAKPGPWAAEQPMTQDHDFADFGMVDFPGGEHDDALDGTGSSPQWIEHYARTRIEELHSRYETFSGGGDERRCAPGTVMDLKGHDRRQYNTKYLITTVSYAASAGDLASSSGSGAEFRCSITAVKAETPFRPARLTPKPVIQGAQTAIVTDWEEPEGWGRVKVKFHWNDESQSCWLRVAQPLAGNKWGFLGIPRPGDEVVVEFLEGDPDRPIVVGCVYNAKSMPPWTLPSERTHTGFKSLSWGGSSGFNELRFDDKAGKEEIYIRAQYDKTVRVEHDRTEWVGNESHLMVQQNLFEKLGADHHIEVTGDRNEKLGGSLSLKVDKDLLGKAGTKIAYDAGSEIHLKSGSTLVLEASSTLSLKVGGNFITINPGGVFIKGSMVFVNSGGSAGTGSGASPEAAKAPNEAHKSEGGKANEAPEKKTANASNLTLASNTVAPPAPTPSPQAQMFKSAAETGTPFCEICNC
jgi:type VI secretion system secreted protein VgrG